MGVTGLLQSLKEIQETTNLEKYKGQTLAVDTYGWLHRGLVSCAQELCQDIPTRKYINSVMKKVDMLRHFGVEPYLVFDGGYLPTKAETAKERRAKREEAKIKADQLVRQGKKGLAWKEFMKAAGVTPQMAKSIMLELDQRGVKYVVAPYEADPQMVYLEKIGVVDGILLEDSDLLIFGCRRLITKLNDFGDCVEICRDRFCEVKKIPQLALYTPEQLRLVAILSGCDYTKGVAGIGLKTAFTLVRRFSSLEKIVASLRNDGKTVTGDFEQEAHRANIAFQFQKVFHPHQQALCTLNDVTEEMDESLLDLCCGKMLDQNLHVQICNGEVHPITFETLISREQSLTSLRSTSVNEPKMRAPPSKPSVTVATKSKSFPKGGIDSFFSLSRLKPELSKVIQPSLEPSAPLEAEVISTVSSRSSESSIKRTVHEIKCNPKDSVSPTTKKIRRIIDVKKSSPVKLASKFFDTLIGGGSLATPRPSWDVSGDSDIPDEFSSPIKLQNKPSQNDRMDETEEIREVEERVERFDDDDDIEDIEESPVKSPTKNQERIKSLTQSLHERFLMAKSFTSKRSTNITKKGELAIGDHPLTPTDLNVDLQFDAEEISEDESQEPEQITKQITKTVVQKTTSTTNVGLQRFAYRG